MTTPDIRIDGWLLVCRGCGAEFRSPRVRRYCSPACYPQPTGPSRRTRRSDRIRDELVEMCCAGLTLDAIGRHYGVTREMARIWLKQQGLTTRRQDSWRSPYKPLGSYRKAADVLLLTAHHSLNDSGLRFCTVCHRLFAMRKSLHSRCRRCETDRMNATRRKSEKIRASSVRWKQQHPESCRAAQERYRAKLDPDEQRARRQARYEANREHDLARSREYYARNREKIAAQNRARYLKRKSTPPEQQP